MQLPLSIKATFPVSDPAGRPAQPRRLPSRVLTSTYGTGPIVLVRTDDALPPCPAIAPMLERFGGTVPATVRFDPGPAACELVDEATVIAEGATPGELIEPGTTPFSSVPSSPAAVTTIIPAATAFST